MLTSSETKIMINRTQSAFNYLAFEIVRNGWASPTATLEMLENLRTFEYSPHQELFDLIKEHGHRATELALEYAFVGSSSLRLDRHQLKLPSNLSEQ